MRRRDLLTALIATGATACLPGSHRHRPRGRLDEPPVTVFLPDDGITHGAEQLAPDLGIALHPRLHIPGHQRGLVLRTEPSRLRVGGTTALVQLNHSHPTAHAPLVLRAHTHQRVLAERAIAAQPYTDAQSGGFDRALLPFRVDEHGPVWIEGEHTTTDPLWIGAIALHPTAPRPFYNVAHRCNTREKLHRALQHGANGVEADVTPVHTASGLRLSLYHAGDVRFTRPDQLPGWLADASELVRTGQLALLMLDLKMPADVPLDAYARAVVAALHQAQVPASRVAVSVPARSASPLLTTLHGELGYRCAVDLYHDLYDDTQQRTWPNEAEQLGASFLGVGLDSAAFWSPMPRWLHWLQALANFRDASSRVHKVYYWTVDHPRSMRHCLDLTMDGIITNHPDRLASVLREPPYAALYRRATVLDPLDHRHAPSPAAQAG